MNDITVTIVGNVATDISLRFTNTGHPVASFRVASTSRRYDRANDRWIDGDTQYYSVSCYKGLATNVVASFTKGMPVLIAGRLRTRESQRQCGDHVHPVRYTDVDATSAGPDLARGTAVFTRVKREAVVEVEGRSIAEARAIADPAA